MFAQVHAGMRLCACVHVLRCGASCALAGRRFCCCCRRAGMPQPPENTPAHAPPPPLRRSWCRRGRGSLWLATAARPSASRCPRVRAGGVGWGGLRWLGGVLHQQASHTPHTPHKQASSSSPGLLDWTLPALRASQPAARGARTPFCLPTNVARARPTAGSCCVLKGYGGDTAMHCVPPVAARRVSITLRRRAGALRRQEGCRRDAGRPARSLSLCACCLPTHPAASPSTLTPPSPRPYQQGWAQARAPGGPRGGAAPARAWAL